MMQHGMCLQLKFEEEKFIPAHKTRAHSTMVEDLWQQELGTADPIASIQETETDKVLS